MGDALGGVLNAFQGGAIGGVDGLGFEVEFLGDRVVDDVVVEVGVVLLGVGGDGDGHDVLDRACEDRVGEFLVELSGLVLADGVLAFGVFLVDCVEFVEGVEDGESEGFDVGWGFVDGGSDGMDRCVGSVREVSACEKDEGVHEE